MRSKMRSRIRSRMRYQMHFLEEKNLLEKICIEVFLIKNCSNYRYLTVWTTSEIKPLNLQEILNAIIHVDFWKMNSSHCYDVKASVSLQSLKNFELPARQGPSTYCSTGFEYSQWNVSIPMDQSAWCRTLVSKVTGPNTHHLLPLGICDRLRVHPSEWSKSWTISSKS